MQFCHLTYTCVVAGIFLRYRMAAIAVIPSVHRQGHSTYVPDLSELSDFPLFLPPSPPPGACHGGPNALGVFTPHSSGNLFHYSLWLHGRPRAGFIVSPPLRPGPSRCSNACSCLLSPLSPLDDVGFSPFFLWSLPLHFSICRSCRRH